MIPIPKFAEDFTVNWLNQALAESGKLGGNRVKSCFAQDSAVPGQTAEIVMLEVEYEVPDPDLPVKMVAKVTSRDPMILEQIIANYDQYRRETSFYREFPEVGISVPECLYERHDPVSQEVIILMRDLAPSASPSWAVSADQVRLALGHLPAFHAKWWNDALLLEKDWIVQFGNRPFYQAAFSAAHAAAPVLDELYDDASLTKEIMSCLAGKVDRAIGFVASRPYTFVHGDYHAKQMFFPTAAGGEFAVIDWQFPFVAQGAWDFARLVGVCLGTPDRRAMQRELLDDYHRGLVANGVRDYSMDELELDFRFGLVLSQMIMSIASADTDPQILQKECDELGVDWRDVIFDRTQRALEEWQALELIKSL